jgi:hypothetical protein
MFEKGKPPSDGMARDAMIRTLYHPGFAVQHVPLSRSAVESAERAAAKWKATMPKFGNKRPIVLRRSLGRKTADAMIESSITAPDKQDIARKRNATKVVQPMQPVKAMCNQPAYLQCFTLEQLACFTTVGKLWLATPEAKQAIGWEAPLQRMPMQERRPLVGFECLLDGESILEDESQHNQFKPSEDWIKSFGEGLEDSPNTSRRWKRGRRNTSRDQAPK